MANRLICFVLAIALVVTFGAGCKKPQPAGEGGELRILSLAPNITEILFAMGLGDQVVGRTSYCNYPSEAASIESVGDSQHLNQEKILALRPTVAFVITRGEDVPRSLEAMGIHAVALQSDRMDQLMSAIETIGRETGHEDAARVLVNSLYIDLASVRERVRGLARPRTLFAFPMMVGSMQMGVAGRGTFVDDLITVAGGENAYPDRADWPEISPERVIALAPEVVVVNATDDSAAPDRVEAIRRAWNRWTSIPAVARDRVSVLTQPYLTIPGPRVGQAARLLAQTLHPEAFGEEIVAQAGAP
jgi:iron complex transport system substrate-binding protein